MPPVPDAFLRIASASYIEFGVKGSSDREVLRDVSFAVERGETVALLGTESEGRGIILRMIAGLIKPTSGFVNLQRKPIEKPGLDRAFVLKETQLFPWLTLAANIEEALRAKKPSLEPQVIRQNAEAVLADAGLAAFAQTLPAKLSAEDACWGVLIRSLAVEPQVLLLEDCFSRLSPLERSRVQTKFQRKVAESPVAIVFSTDDPEDAALLADRIALVSAVPAARIRQAIYNPGARQNVDKPGSTAAVQAVQDRIRNALEGLSKSKNSVRMPQMHHA
jgi:nitrate/nitrite transport system ATP-binding protein